MAIRVSFFLFPSCIFFFFFLVFRSCSANFVSSSQLALSRFVLRVSFCPFFQSFTVCLFFSFLCIPVSWFLFSLCSSFLFPLPFFLSSSSSSSFFFFFYFFFFEKRICSTKRWARTWPKRLSCCAPPWPRPSSRREPWRTTLNLSQVGSAFFFAFF